MWTELLKRSMFPKFSIVGEEEGGGPVKEEKPPVKDELSDGEKAILDQMEKEESESSEEKEPKGDEDPDKNEPEDKSGEKEKPPKSEETEDKDENGVPWKNRAKEHERKAAEKERLLAEKDAEIARLAQQMPAKPPQMSPQEYRTKLVEQLKTQYPTMDEDQLNAVLDISTTIASAQVDHALTPFRPTVRDFHVNTAKAAVSEKEKKFFEKHKAEFEEVLSQIPEQAKMTPEGARHAVTNAILIVKGKHADEIEASIDARIATAVEAALKKTNKRIADNDASGGERGGNNLSGVSLTKEQERQCKELGYDKQQYASLLKGLQAKAKERNQPIPQVLS